MLDALSLSEITLAQAAGFDWRTAGLWGGAVLFCIVCLILILTVLIQRPQGGGLSGAFGASGGSGQTAFGAKTGDALTIATIVMFVVFLGVAIALNFLARPETIPAGPAQQQLVGEGDAAEAGESPAEDVTGESVDDSSTVDGDETEAAPVAEPEDPTETPDAPEASETPQSADPSDG